MQVDIVGHVWSDLQTTLGAISAGTDGSARTVAATTAVMCLIGFPVLLKLIRIFFTK